MKQETVKLYVVPHSHIDLEWYWTVEDLEKMLDKLFYNSSLRIMEQDHNMTFAQDQAFLLEMMLKNASEQERKLVIDSVSTGRLEVVGGMYVQPELQEPCGESLIRQIQIGQKWMRECLGRQATCAWHIDTFGQVNQMPQILLQSGFQNYVFMRDVNEDEDPLGFPTEFYYEGIDGSRILSHWLKNTYVLCESGEEETLLKIANVTVTPENEQQELQKVFEAILNPNSLQHQTGAALILWGDDLYEHNLSTDQICKLLLEAGKRVGVALQEADIVFATPSQFFHAVEDSAGQLPVKNNDFDLPKYRQDLRATFISRIKLKLMNRQVEQALLSLECLSALVRKPIDQIDELWKPVLFNHFHDTIGGSCIDEVYTAAMERYESVLQNIAEQKKIMLNTVSAAEYICVFNPTQYIRSDTVFVNVSAEHSDYSVVDTKGDALSTYFHSETSQLEVFIPEIGPYEMKSLMLVSGKQTEIKTSSNYEIENQFYKLKVDCLTGDLLCVWDKCNRINVLGGVGNVIVAMEEHNPDMEGELHVTGKEYSEQGLNAEYVRVITSDLASTVLIRKHFLGFTLEKKITLRNNSQRIEFTTDIVQYTGEDLLIRVDFPMHLQNPQSVFETPFGVALNRKGFHCAQKWAGLKDVSYASAILNQGTCAYWANGNLLSMALLRGHRNYSTYGEYGRQRGMMRFFDGKTHAELAAEQGNHQFNYALYCGRIDAAEITSQAMIYNTPLEAWLVEKPVELYSPVKEISEDFIVTKLTMLENENLCLRGYYMGKGNAECKLELTQRVAKAYQTNLLDEKQKILQVDGNIVTFPTRPFEIVTLHIETTHN